jgi:hypothetical protein
MNLSPVFRQRFFDVNGVPLAGGQLWTYVAGTTTPQVSYSNATGTPNTNPVILDAYGYADVWFDPSLAYKVVLEDVNGVQQWSVDQITFPAGISTWNANTTYSQGALALDASGYGLIYVSLIGSNVNNALSNVSAWRLLGGQVRTLTANTTLAVTDGVVRSNSTAGALTHTLPPINTSPIGTKIIVKEIGTGGYTTTIKGSGSDAIDGNNTYAVALVEYASVIFANNGTSWDVISTGTITATQIANATITATQIANATITATQIANATITGTQMASNVNLAGNAVQENGRNLAVAGYNDSTSLAIVRGVIAGNGSIVSGSGFSVAGSGGVWAITFTNAFSAQPAVTANTIDPYGDSFCTLGTVNTASQVDISTWALPESSSGTFPAVATGVAFCFIAIGPR